MNFKSDKFNFNRILKTIILLVILNIFILFLFFLFTFSGFLVLEREEPTKVVLTGSILKDVENKKYYFTTVNAREVRGYELLYKHYIKNQRVFQLIESNAGVYDSEMKESKNIAITIAKNKASDKVTGIGEGVIVNKIKAGSQASKSKILLGDVIIGVNNTMINNVHDFREVIKGNSELRLDVISNEKREIKIISGIKNEIGIGISTAFRNISDDIEIVTDGVGGGSAGLIFTLSVLDALTDGDLSGGKTISGSGSIDEFGNIGKVDGIELKFQSAVILGSDIFFVNSENYKDLKNARRGGTKIIEVNNIDGIINYLCSNGGDSDDACGKNKSTDNKK